MKKHTLIVAFGESAARNAEQYGYYVPEAEIFSFDTEAELKAFIKGMEAMNGWMDVSYMDANALPDHEIVELASANCFLSIATGYTFQPNEDGTPDYNSESDLTEAEESDWFRFLSDEDYDQLKRAFPHLKTHTKEQVADYIDEGTWINEIPDEQDLKMPDYDAFLDTYKPEYNTFYRAKLPDTATEAVLDSMTAYNGKMYETFGEELDYVRSQPADRTWTLIEADGKQYISPGFHIVNRQGYFITEIAWATGQEDHFVN